MQGINAATYKVVFQTEGYAHINSIIASISPSKIAVLVDENTHQYCLPIFLGKLETTADIEIIEIESGEANKTINSCISLWSAFTELQLDRKSLLINLGGGVITDMGGFIASTYKRGMPFIHVPTTLLSMVDASIGGKTGVDFNGIKNLIGVINSPHAVLIDTVFLNTLKEREFKSGLAEMFKHGLIHSKAHWEALITADMSATKKFNTLIADSISIKNNVVLKDLNENNIRKTLNFGHTLGHAIETYYLEHPDKDRLLHGEAIGIGMILEAFLSQKLLNLPETDLERIKDVFLKLYEHVRFDENDIKAILQLLVFDKKNTHGQVNFVLLESIGTAKIDCHVPEALILDAFEYYHT